MDSRARVGCTYLGFGGGVKGCTPSFHAIQFFSVYDITEKDALALDHLHERVIDRDDKDFSGVLKLVATDIAGDVSGRA